MLLKWLNAREATEVGVALADHFAPQAVSGSAGARRPETRGHDLQKFMQRFLQRVDRDARPLKLNLFKRAKLANSFKWRLLENGVEQQVVDELTQALVLRLTAKRGDMTPGAGPPPDSRGRRVNPGALLVQGDRCMVEGAYAEAASTYQDLLNFDSHNPVARNSLGAAFSKLGRYREAEEEFRRAIGIRSGYADAHYNLGTVLQWQGLVAESEMPLRRALKLKPTYVDAQIRLGTTLVLLGRLRDARVFFEKVLKLAPRNVRALVGMAQVAAPEGRLAEAEALLKRAVEIDAKDPAAWAALVWQRKMTSADAAWLKGAEESVAGGTKPVEEPNIRYAIGKYYDDVGDFAKAFRNYQRANELLKLRAAPYDRDAHRRYVDDLMRVYRRETLTGARADASDSALPVLVTGMMRSGTSLVEQIIASHPSARGAGELTFWAGAVSKHGPALRRALPDAALKRKLADGYLRELAGRFPDARRVVDKAPVNSDYLGVIHSVLPNARMIYLRRDPVDTCLSCYFQQFSVGVNFAMDLSDLAYYYREHQRLVAHWRAALPSGVMLDVPYAELVADQETWSRRILDFIGLEWDARCLEFYKTDRTVMTASYWQVRQKIYQSSVGRWRNYQKFIGPLLELRELD